MPPSLMLFHDANPVPPKLSNKHPKIHFREQTPTTKRDAPKEVTFIDDDDPTPVETQQKFQPTPYIHPTSKKIRKRRMYWKIWHEGTRWLQPTRN